MCEQVVAMRKAFVAVTDFDWYSFLSHRPDLTEVNFWQPGGKTRFKTLSRGDLFLFKLHSPNNFIVGGGFYSASSLLPVSIAWETFGPMNGVASLPAMRLRIAKYRREDLRPGDDPTIGNIVLTGAFFLRRGSWIPSPSDFSLNIVQGKSYDLDTGTGRELGAALQLALQRGQVSAKPVVAEGEIVRMFSEPALARRRLGQGGFRLVITESFERQCAVTREHTLPVLDAAHIRPVTQQGQHAANNGLLLRSDVHTLFDRGYVTVTPDYKFRVSRRLDEEWQNGKVYYAFDNRPIHLPRHPEDRPDPKLLEWHSDTVFIK